MLIAAQDDASTKMKSADYAIFDKLGGQNVILKDSFRSSYALVGYSGPGRPSWIKQVCSSILPYELMKCNVIDVSVINDMT